jgi:small conductance mechanosensitive channel
MAKNRRKNQMSDLNYVLQQQGVDTASKDDEKMKPSEIVLLVVALLIAVAYYIVLIYGGKIFGADNIYYLSLNVFSDIANPIRWIRIVSYIILIVSIEKFAGFIISMITRSDALTRKSGIAFYELIGSLIQYAAIIALIFLVMSALGVDTTAILAGLGILTLIFGLGAQSIVEDLVAGFFIIVEHVYDVGDIIAVNGFRGMVKAIGLRSTQIEDVGGNIMNVRNSRIGDMINMTDLLSVATCEAFINDSAKLPKTEEVLEQELPKMKERIPELLDGPFYLGVEKVDKAWNVITLSFLARCEEGAKYRVERALREELLLLIDSIKFEEDGDKDKEENEDESSKA